MVGEVVGSRGWGPVGRAGRACVWCRREGCVKAHSCVVLGLLVVLALCAPVSVSKLFAVCVL